MNKYSKLRGADRNLEAAASLRNGAEPSEILFQPIAELGTGRVIAYKALCGRPGELHHAPGEWFGDAKAGVDSEFALALITRTIQGVRAFPGGVALAVNAVSSVLASGWLAEAIAGLPHEQIIVELAKDREPGDKNALLEQALLLQFRGVRIAMNGPGPGQSGLRQIVRIRPDLVNIDRQLISGIGTDAAKRALVAGHVGLAREIGAEAVGEGLETRQQLATARAMGIQLGQGWAIGRPVDLGTALAELSLMRYIGVA